jgi:hypothetical protein
MARLVLVAILAARDRSVPAAEAAGAAITVTGAARKRRLVSTACGGKPRDVPVAARANAGILERDLGAPPSGSSVAAAAALPV